MDETPKKNIFAWVPLTGEFHLEMFHFYYQRLKWSIGVFLYQTQLCTEPIVAMTEQKLLVHNTFSHFVNRLLKHRTNAKIAKVWGIRIPFKELMTQKHDCLANNFKNKLKYLKVIKLIDRNPKVNSCFQHTLLTSTSGILTTCEKFFSLQKNNKTS